MLGIKVIFWRRAVLPSDKLPQSARLHQCPWRRFISDQQSAQQSAKKRVSSADGVAYLDRARFLPKPVSIPPYSGSPFSCSHANAGQSMLRRELLNASR